jgi:hypothetical protein
MSRLSASSQQRYNEIMGIGGQREAGPGGLFPRALGPTIVKVRDPMEPFEELAEQIMEGDPEGRKANRRLRKRQHQRVSTDEHGNGLLYGKRCCFEAVQVLNKELERLHLPWPFVCGQCGTVYSIEMRTREERRHV